MTYALLTRRSQGTGNPICQFCIWSTFILSSAEESSKYFLSIGAAEHYSEDLIARFNQQHTTLTMCPQLRATAHMPYLGVPVGESKAYKEQALLLFMEGLCRGTTPSVADCLSPLCSQNGWDVASSLQPSAATWERHRLYASTSHELACAAAFDSKWNEVSAWQRAQDSLNEQRTQICEQQHAGPPR